MMEGPGADSEEKHEPVSDIDTVAVDSLKAISCHVQKIIIRTIDEIVPLITEVRAAAQRTAHALAELTTVGLDGVEILRRMKFTEMAWHPMVPRATAQPHRTNQSDLDHSCQSKGPSVSI